MNKKKMRYCRVVFTKTGFPPVEVDFGFYYQEDKNSSIKKLREKYSDHVFLRCYAIEQPSWSRQRYQGEAP